MNGFAAFRNSPARITTVVVPSPTCTRKQRGLRSVQPNTTTRCVQLPLQGQVAELLRLHTPRCLPKHVT